MQLEVQRGASRIPICIELDRGHSYRIVACDAEREEILERLVETGSASVVSPGGGLIGNLKVWENLVLPVAWRARARTSGLEARARTLLAELGFEGERFSALCRAMPETLSAFEARAVAFARAMLLEPEIVVFDRLLDGLARAEHARAGRFENLFHLRFPFRTAVFIDAEPPGGPWTAMDRDFDLRVTS